MTRNSSNRGAWLIDFLGYLGLRGRRRVFGRWKETEVRFLVCAWELVPARAAFFAALALVVLDAGAADLAFEDFVAAIGDEEEVDNDDEQAKGKTGV